MIWFYGGNSMKVLVLMFLILPIKVTLGLFSGNWGDTNESKNLEIQISYFHQPMEEVRFV